MMDVRDTKNSLDAMAGQIDSVDEYGAQRLRDLSFAVGGGANADAWASTDIYRLIEPDQIIARYKHQRKTEGIIAILEWIRNTLIFAPLVVTWFGVSQAVEKYHDLIKADSNQITQPFLFLWQDGFGHRLQGWQTLGTLATVDFILLAIVLFLTIFVYSLSNGFMLKREQEAEDLRNLLAHTMASAILHLQTRTWQQPTNILTRFEQASKQFETIFTKLQKETETFATKLLQEIDTVAKRQGKEMQAFTDFKRDLTTIMSSVSSSVAEVKTSNQDLKRTLNSLIAPAQTLATKQNDLLTGVQDAVNLFKLQIASQQSIVKEQEKWGQELSKVLTSLKDTVEQGKFIAKDIEDFTKKQTGLVSAMENERKELANMANRVYTATQSLTSVVQQIDKCAVELQAINVNMDSLVRRVAALR